MIEHFGHFQSSSKECMLRDILAMEAAGKRGKIVVLKGWPGFAFIDCAAMAKPLAEKREIARKRLGVSSGSLFGRVAGKLLFHL